MIKQALLVEFKKFGSSCFIYRIQWSEYDSIFVLEDERKTKKKLSILKAYMYDQKGTKWKKREAAK